MGEAGKFDDIVCFFMHIDKTLRIRRNIPYYKRNDETEFVKKAFFFSSTSPENNPIMSPR